MEFAALAVITLACCGPWLCIQPHVIGGEGNGGYEQVLSSGAVSMAMSASGLAHASASSDFLKTASDRAQVSSGGGAISLLMQVRSAIDFGIASGFFDFGQSIIKLLRWKVFWVWSRFPSPAPDSPRIDNELMARHSTTARSMDRAVVVFGSRCVRPRARRCSPTAAPFDERRLHRPGLLQRACARAPCFRSHRTKTPRPARRGRWHASDPIRGFAASRTSQADDASRARTPKSPIRPADARSSPAPGRPRPRASCALRAYR